MLVVEYFTQPSTDKKHRRSQNLTFSFQKAGFQLVNAQQVTIAAGNSKSDIYDAVNRVFLARGVKGNLTFSIDPDAARVLVVIPAGKKYTVENGKLLAGGVPVDFRYE